MKIIGGKFKNRNFYVPAGIRPTRGITRKAVFDLIGQDLSGSTFLDLFAGSGAVGLEALSRGAKRATFVEKEPKFTGVIEDNLRLFGLERTFTEFADYEIINSDAFACIKDFHRRDRSFDIIFMDPPYGRGLTKKTLKTMTAHDIISVTSLIVAEHSHRVTLPNDIDGRFFIFRQRRYGLSSLTVYQRR